MGMPVTATGDVDPEAGARWVRRNIDRTRCAPVRGRVRSPLVPEPPAAAESPESDPVSAAVRMTLVWLASRLPAAVATRVMEAGFDRTDAERLFELVAGVAEAETRELFQTMSLHCPLHASWEVWRMPSFEPMPEATTELQSAASASWAPRSASSSG
jgi:hypothetical protein